MEKSDSKNCTAVVTTTGISQVSAARVSRSVSGVDTPSSGRSNWTPEWCSSMFSGPKMVRKVSAVCSMMEVYGMTYTTRFIPLAFACARAKAREATVLPPPVGTVKVYRPGFRSCPCRMHCSRMAQRLAFSSPFGGNQPDM